MVKIREEVKALWRAEEHEIVAEELRKSADAVAVLSRY